MHISLINDGDNYQHISGCLLSFEVCENKHKTPEIMQKHFYLTLESKFIYLTQSAALI